MPDQILAGKQILITGASSGIGAETAKLLSSHGAMVIVHYHHHQDEALALVDQIKDFKGNAIAVQCDLLDRPSCHRLISSVTDSIGRLDALVNNAGGVLGAKFFLDLEDIAWDQTFALNVHAPFILSRDAFAHMQTSGGGKIINISSIGVKYGGSLSTMHYAAAKSALETLTLGMAKAGAPHHILVNTIRPGFIMTPFHANTPADSIHQRIQKILLKRAGAPKDVADMILFLLAPSGDFITGQIFSVTGGD